MGLAYSSDVRVPIRLFFIVALSCAAGRYESHVYRGRDVAFQTGDPGKRWTSVSLPGANVVLHREGGGTLLANGLCGEAPDVPLEVLANQALFDVTDKVEWSRRLFTLDGRAALRVRMAGAVDGVPVELDLVVLRRDGCVYDLQLVSSSPAFAASDAEFQQFIDGFRTLPER